MRDRDCVERMLREILSDFLESESDIENVAVFLWSENDCGKTFVVSRVLKDRGVNPLHVKGSGIAPREASYFEEVFHEFCKAASIPTHDANLELSFSISFLGFTLRLRNNSSLSNRLYRQVDFMARHLNEDGVDPEQLVFFIENLQNIDGLSAELFRRLANRLNRSLVIYEFESDNDNAVRKLIETVIPPNNECSRTEPVKMPPPSPCDLKSIAKEKANVDLSAAQAAGVFKNSNDSLTSFISECASFGSNSRRLRFSTRLDRVVAWIISLHGTPLSPSDLGCYLESVDMTQYPGEGLDAVISRLTAAGAIAIENDSILLLREPSSSNDCIHDSEKSIALRAVIYRTRLIPEKTPNEMLRLVNAQIEARDFGIVDTLPLLGATLGKIKYDKRFVERAAQMTNSMLDIHNPDVMRVERAFLDAFLEIGDLESAQLYLEDLSAADDLTDVYRFIVSASSRNDIEIERQYHSLLSRHAGNGRLALFISLNIASYFMRFAKEDKAFAFLNYLASCEDATKAFPEFYWILKQRTIYLSRNEAICDLKKCMSYFKSHGYTGAYARTRMTYALRTAIGGDPKRALEIFRSDFEEQLDPICPDCFYLNNIAACMLMLNQNVRAASEMLKSALSYPMTPYEATLVKCNYFAACLSLDDHEELREKAQELLHLSHSSYRASPPTHMCLTNLLEYCRRMNPSMEEEVIRKLRILQTCCSSALSECIEAQISDLELPSSHQFFYITQHKFRPGFIGFWQMQVDRSLTDGIIANRE